MSADNTLFPIFLKLHQLQTLIVGGGHVGFEKLNALLKNDPKARITLVGSQISVEIKDTVAHNERVFLHERNFEEEDLMGIDILILATEVRQTNQHIAQLAKARKILVNVADTPDLCDFYLGATVAKGPLKIGISTNGQSPTFAKRLREILEEALPDETSDLLHNLRQFRDRLKGDFSQKVHALNEHTKALVSK